MSSTAQYLTAFLVIFALLGLFAIVLRRLSGSGRFQASGSTKLRTGMLDQGGSRSRPSRLGIVDIYDLDNNRQLVLLRRDSVEHLVMIGGSSDVVIEHNITRVQPAQSLPTSQTASPSEETSQPITVPRVSPALLKTAATLRETTENKLSTHQRLKTRDTASAPTETRTAAPHQRPLQDLAPAAREPEGSDEGTLANTQATKKAWQAMALKAKTILPRVSAPQAESDETTSEDRPVRTVETRLPEKAASGSPTARLASFEMPAKNPGAGDPISPKAAYESKHLSEDLPQPLANGKPPSEPTPASVESTMARQLEEALRNPSSAVRPSNSVDHTSSASVPTPDFLRKPSSNGVSQPLAVPASTRSHEKGPETPTADSSYKPSAPFKTSTSLEEDTTDIFSDPMPEKNQLSQENRTLEGTSRQGASLPSQPPLASSPPPLTPARPSPPLPNRLRPQLPTKAPSITEDDGLNDELLMESSPATKGQEANSSQDAPDELFSVEAIEAEFARLLGRTASGKGQDRTT